MVTINRSEAPTTEEAVAAFERRIGARLPEDYRAFLLRHNGGQPTRKSFRFGDGAYQDSCVDWFLALYDGEHDYLEKYWKGYVEYQRIPDGLIPIAHDPGDSIICLGIQGELRGKVFFWDFAHEPDDGEPSFENTFAVADSFSEFLQRLT